MIRTSAPVVAIVMALSVVLFSQAATAQRITWIKTLGGPSFDMLECLHVAPDGSCSAIGTFSDSIDVGGIVLQSIGSYDVFTSRYSAKGNLGTAAAHGGLDADEGQSTVVDNKGNVYFAGAFIDVAVIAGEQVEGLTASSMDMFIAKTSKEGLLQWIKVFGSPTYDEGAPSIAVDSTGNIYVAGGVGGTGQFGTKTYKSVGTLDAFVAKMNANGDFLWVQGAGSSDNDRTSHVHVTPNGDRVYAVGNFIGQVNFGSNTIESFVNRTDFFVRALNASGQPLWCKRIGSSEPDFQIGANTTSDGKLLVTGAMRLTTTFDTKTLKADGENASDVFVARVSKDGEFELLRRYGSTFEEIATCIVADAKGNMFVGGSFDSTTIMDSFQEDSKGASDGFIMRLVANGDVDWVRTFGGPYEDAVTGVGIDAKGIPYVGGTFETYAWFDDQKITGKGFDDLFIAALDCGPSTQLRPSTKQLKLCEGMYRPIVARLGYPSYEWFINGTKGSEPSFTLKTTNLKAGTYTIYCRIKGFDECIKNTDTIKVIVRPGLDVPVITKSGNDLTCSTDLVNYQWYREGKKISGATSRVVKIDGDGNYRVLISDTAGCERWSENFLVGTTSVDDLIDGTSIAVYPNPTSGTFTIAGAEGVEVSVSDVMGRVVSYVASAAPYQSLEIDGAVGTYVVTLRSGGQSRSIILQKR
ncbi:MAG: T9SS type A sorting domain-containing protein [Candidatus Kapaibacterium sp.]